VVKVQCTNNSDRITSTSELLLRHNNVTAHAHQSWLADFRLTPAQQRSTGQNLPSDLYFTENSLVIDLTNVTAWDQLFNIQCSRRDTPFPSFATECTNHGTLFEMERLIRNYT
jgi:hypothetical protein